MSYRVQQCRGEHCSASIIWAQTNANTWMIVDVDQVPGGNVELQERAGMPPLARVLKPDPDVKRYRPHWSSCPDAGTFRRR